MKLGITLALLGLVGLIFLFLNPFSEKQNTDNTSSSTFKETQNQSPKPQNVSYEASFAIYTHGTVRIFTDSRYHNLSPDVYIEPPNPNIVQINKAGITWDDFFNTLPMKVTEECLTTGTGQVFCTGAEGSLEFYLNGIKAENVLSKVIRENDKLLITFGNQDQAEIERQIQSIPELQ